MVDLLVACDTFDNSIHYHLLVTLWYMRISPYQQGYEVVRPPHRAICRRYMPLSWEIWYILRTIDLGSHHLGELWLLKFRLAFLGLLTVTTHNKSAICFKRDSLKIETSGFVLLSIDLMPFLSLILMCLTLDSIDFKGSCPSMIDFSWSFWSSTTLIDWLNSLYWTGWWLNSWLLVLSLLRHDLSTRIESSSSPI